MQTGLIILRPLDSYVTTEDTKHIQTIECVLANEKNAPLLAVDNDMDIFHEAEPLEERRNAGKAA